MDVIQYQLICVITWGLCTQYGLCCVVFCSLHWGHNGRDNVSNHQPHDCFLNGLLRRRSNKTVKLRVTGLCTGNSPGTGEFPAQRASNAENVSTWWRHHVCGTGQYYPCRPRLLVLGQSWLWINPEIWYGYMYYTNPNTMTSSNGNIFRVTGPLWGEFTGHRWIPLTKASDAELWYFLWSAPEWINGWVNIREAGDWRPRRAHHNVIVMNMCNDYYNKIKHNKTVHTSYRIYCKTHSWCTVHTQISIYIYTYIHIQERCARSRY